MGGKWSLGYWFFRGYVSFAWWLFHRKIMVVGRENIPRNKPVIYAPNHPNALNDDLAIVCSVRHQVVWLGRADLFNSALARPFLKFLKIIPVYRIRDGKENLSRNEQTFATAVELLKKNQAIGLYPEAAHSENRRMLPHKKGIPRIVSQAGKMTGYTLDIHIVPVGIYFDRYQEFGRRLLIIYGKPVKASDYYGKYQVNDQTATIALRDDLFRAILPLTLNFSPGNHYQGFEALREILSKPLLRKSGKPENLYNRLLTDQQIMETLGRIEAEDPTKAALLAGKALHLTEKLKALGLRNWLIDKPEEKTGKMWLRIFFLAMTTPVFAFGFLMNFLPFFLLDSLVKRKVKKEIFRSTFSFALGIFLFPMVYLLEIAALSPFLPGLGFKLLFLASLPFSGKFAWHWVILFRKTAGRWRWMRIKRTNPSLYQEVHKEKYEITNAVLGNGGHPGISG